MEAGIAVAGDDEGGGRIVLRDQAAQGRDDIVRIGLRFDAEGPFGKRRAGDARPWSRKRDL
jgi:hypothetical protein